MSRSHILGGAFWAALIVVSACGGTSENGRSPGAAASAGGSAGSGAGDSGSGAGPGGTPLRSRAAEPTWCAAGVHPATLPTETVTCEVTDRLARTVAHWDWEPTTLTLTESGTRSNDSRWDVYWTYDTNGRIARYGSTEQPFTFQYQYDDNGQMLAATSDTSGNSRYENEYDDTGRLVRMALIPSSGAPWAQVYGYDDAARLVSSDGDVGLDGVRDMYTTYTYHRDCSLELLEQQGSYHGFVDGAVVVRNRYFYDDADRLARRESDGGGYFDTPADGNVDEIDSWGYGADGSIASFERDGTADDTGGPADGVPDESLAFSASCSRLIGLHRELFRLPN